MDTETLTQVVETIKALNLTFNGNLNSETLQQITGVVAPYITWYFIKDFLSDVMACVALSLCVYWIMQAVIKTVGKKND